MKYVGIVLAMVAIIGVVACSSPSLKVKGLRLGMTSEEVKKQMGEPFTVRAAKVFADGQTTEVWEYLSGITLNPKDYWIFFENGKVVQWGEPGDFTGKPFVGGATVEPYKPERIEKP